MINANWNIGSATPVGKLTYLVDKLSQKSTNAFFNSTCSKQSVLALPESKRRLANELKRSKRLGKTDDGQQIYLFDYRINSAVIRELGRLRELSFRAVGEGTYKLRDLDRYDKSYRHIILWNEQDQEIVGAYRVGEVFSLTKTNKRKLSENKTHKCNINYSNLYTNELFQYKAKFDAIAPYAIELGRSFIQPSYWNKRGLDYLWQGVGTYLQTHPHVRYLLGAVSISNNYPELAKQEIVGFYQYFYQPKTAKEYAEAKRKFVVNRAVLEGYRGLKLSDAKIRLKQSLLKQNVTLPALYKHYAELCEQSGINFFDFNVDPDFEHCIDGLIMIDLTQLKEIKKSRYLRAS